jgi:hypothetical protein
LKINWYELSENLHFETWAKKYLQFFETIPQSVEIFFFSEKKELGQVSQNLLKPRPSNFPTKWRTAQHW